MDSDASEDERNIPDRASIIRDIQDDRPNHSSDASDASDDDAGGGMMCEEDEPTYLMPRQKDWKTIPEELRRPRNYITTDFFGEDFMRIPENKIFTMDAVSKCWEVIHPESPTLLYDETDGGTWAFCEQCVAQLPRNIQSILYFFHMLMASVDDLKYYAVPSKNITLRKKRGEKNIIKEMMWHKPYEPPARDAAEPSMGSPLDTNFLMCNMAKRNARQLSNTTVKIPPIKLKLGFTGAIYKYKGEDHRKLIAVLTVTWARNWDMLGYIQDSFLREPCKKTPNYKLKLQENRQMNYIWKAMARFVAFENLGLDPSICGLPEDFEDQPGGKLGKDALFNMFQIPFQIYGIIRKEILEKEQCNNPALTLKDITLQSLDIIGLPRLPFLLDEITKDYASYMYAYVNNLSNERAGLLQSIKQCYKGKKKGEEQPEENDESAMGSFELNCPGAWPLERNEDGEYTKFGLPKLPIWLNFRYEMTLDCNATQESWQADIGGTNGIPELPKTCLRSFLVQDLGAPQDVVYQTWDHFLRDRRHANPSLVLQEYYGEKADPLSSLLTVGHLRPWWLGVVKDIQAQRRSGLAIFDATQSLHRYLISSLYYHRSSIQSGAYRSIRIVQSLQIIDKMDFKRVCLEDPNEDDPTSIKGFTKFLCSNLSRERRYDPYVRANEAFWKGFEMLNRDFMMNSSNLEFMIEIMLSQLLWMFGPNNDTMVGYFQGLQQMAGNGHFTLSDKNGTRPDRRKPNSTGMDWTHGRLTELFQMLLDLFGIMDPKQNLQTPLNCMGWTPASIPLLTNATITEGQIESLPDTTLGLRSLIATEVRDNSLSMMIRGVFPRNSDGQEQFMINTCDPDKTNRRKQQIKRKVADLQFCGMSSNVADADDKDAEMSKTLTTVIHVMPPGSGPHTKRRKNGAFNNITCSQFGGRQSKPKRQEAFAHMFPYTHVWSTVHLLMNKAGVVPTELAPTSLAFLDWLFFYIRESCEGVLDKYVLESFKRMKDGYEARQVAKSAWTKSIMFLSSCDTPDEASVRFMQSMFCNAMPLPEIPPAAHSFLTRGVHMGALLMVACIAKHLEVPILTLENLQTFFDTDEMPADQEDKHVFDQIKNWLSICVARNRFCPENPGLTNNSNNISPYITSDGNMDGTPQSDKDTLLRVKKSKIQTQDEAHNAVGRRVKELWGRPLCDTCHMGPEACIYSNAIHDLMFHFMPDFRQLISGRIFDTQKHLRKLGFDLPGIQDWPRDAERPPVFARSFTFINGHNGQEPTGMGIGVHWVSLLLCVALADGATLHPKISSNFSRNVLRKILQHAPVCATPGNNIPVRSFNLHTTITERIIVPRQDRPQHFPRPMDDWNFTNTGVFTYTRAIGRFMPEDAMHCGGLFQFAQLLNCDIMELPARGTPIEYELLPNTSYALWRKADEAFGTIEVVTRDSKVKARIIKADGEDAAEWGMDDDWHQGLRDLDMLIVPMIWRQGACVYRGNNVLGCIVPPAGGQQKNNFNAEQCGYNVVVDRDGPLRRMHFAKVIERLVPVGVEVLVDLHSDEVKALGLNIGRQDRDKQFLLARLNVPTVENPEPGKVYVSCLQKPIFARSDVNDSSSVTLAISPWNIKCAEGVEEDFVKFLVVGRP